MTTHWTPQKKNTPPGANRVSNPDLPDALHWRAPHRGLPPEGLPTRLPTGSSSRAAHGSPTARRARPKGSRPRAARRSRRRAAPDFSAALPSQAVSTPRPVPRGVPKPDPPAVGSMELLRIGHMPHGRRRQQRSPSRVAGLPWTCPSSPSRTPFPPPCRSKAAASRSTGSGPPAPSPTSPCSPTGGGVPWEHEASAPPPAWRSRRLTDPRPHK